MKTLSPDTSPEAERVLIELTRKTPIYRKLEMLAQMNQALYTLALSGLRARHPNASDVEVLTQRRRGAEVQRHKEMQRWAMFTDYSWLLLNNGIFGPLHLSASLRLCTFALKYLQIM